MILKVAQDGTYRTLVFIKGTEKSVREGQMPRKVEGKPEMIDNKEAMRENIKPQHGAILHSQN